MGTDRLDETNSLFRNFAKAPKSVSEKSPLYRMENLAGSAFFDPTLILIWTCRIRRIAIHSTAALFVDLLVRCVIHN